MIRRIGVYALMAFVCVVCVFLFTPRDYELCLPGQFRLIHIWGKTHVLAREEKGLNTTVAGPNVRGYRVVPGYVMGVWFTRNT